MTRIKRRAEIGSTLRKENERTGGLFHLAPAWVGRPGIVVPGRRLKLLDDYLARDVVVDERWLASVTYADNGAYNKICPQDHGYSYMVVGKKRIQLRDALEVEGELLLGKGRKWDILPKFFDNRDRLPFHLHPCDRHVRKGLRGKPESYYFPPELNMNKNTFPLTAFGIDPTYTDRQILSYLRMYFRGDNRLTDLSNQINLIPGTGWYSPPCTLHAPGSLVTYEVQAATDVYSIPESRVNDMPMPPETLDRDLPVKVAREGKEAVLRYILKMIHCRQSGNRENFRKEYFRPPVEIFSKKEGSQHFIVYRTGKASQKRNRDLYSAKRTIVHPGKRLGLKEKSAFGAVILSGRGTLQVPGKEPVEIASASVFPDPKAVGKDEVFITREAARELEVECRSEEILSIYQHFPSGSNPEATKLSIPEFTPF